MKKGYWSKWELAQELGLRYNENGPNPILDAYLKDATDIVHAMPIGALENAWLGGDDMIWPCLHTDGHVMLHHHTVIMTCGIPVRIYRW